MKWYIKEPLKIVARSLPGSYFFGHLDMETKTFGRENFTTGDRLFSEGMRTLLPISALVDYVAGGFESGDLMSRAIGYCSNGKCPNFH